MNRSFSKAQLYSICAYPLHPDAPRVVEPPNEYAALGTELHDAAECTIDGLPLPRMSRAAKRLHESWLRGWWRHQVGVAWRAELSFALNVVTGEAREYKLETKRDYPELGGDWWFGTTDAVTVRKNVLLIPDWKTGSHPPRAFGNAQLASLAVAASRVYGATRAVVSIVSVRDEGVVVDACELDAHDLDEQFARLVDIHARAPNAVPNPGPHCGSLWCSLRAGACPAIAKKEVA